MHFKTFFCAALFTAMLSMNVLAGEHSAQMVSFSGEPGDSAAIRLTSQKVITESFSFKMPKDWDGQCVLVPYEDGCDIYDRAAYEADGSGLLFTIACYENIESEELQEYTILGFCNDKTYVLESYYEDFYDEAEDGAQPDFEEAARLIKKSFVSYIKEEAAE